MKYADLSQILNAQTPVYPGDPTVEIERLADVEKDGFCLHQLKTGTHVATHVDAPLHSIAGGQTIDQYAPEKFTGRGVLVNVKGERKVDESFLMNVKMNADDIVLVYTGQAENFHKSSYFTETPELTPGFAQKLVEAKVKMVG